jgi:hypothetical protein
MGNTRGASSLSRHARRFEFVPYGEAYTGNEKSICVDGLVKGADLDLTHWTNNKTPREYKADLSVRGYRCRNRTPFCARQINPWRHVL